MENKLQLLKKPLLPASPICGEKILEITAAKDFRAIAMIERELTPALSFGKKSLALFKKEKPEQLYEALENLLMKLCMSVNVGKNLNEWQIAELAGDLYQKYYFFSLEEIMLVLKKGRNGEFGKLFDRLDGAIVLEWFEKYDTSPERTGLVENMRMNQNKDHQSQNVQALRKLFENPQMRDLVDEISARSMPDSGEYSENYQAFKVRYYKTRIEAERRHPEQAKEAIEAHPQAC